MKKSFVNNIKKIIGLVSFFIVLILVSLHNFGNLVFEVKTPNEIYVDLNSNLIFDERNPVVFNDIYYVTQDIDTVKYPIFKDLTEEEKFFLEYKAKETAKNLIENKYVHLNNNDIEFNNEKSYKKELLESKFVFDDSIQSQKDLFDNIKSINLDDYVILNIKNKKYHKISCKEGRKSSKYKIIKLSEITENNNPCKLCNGEVNKNIIPVNNVENYIKPNFAQDVFEMPCIKIFFIDFKVLKPDNKCTNSACRALKNEIDNAQSSIDMALYGISNQPEIVKSIIEAYKRGVKIRIVFDYSDKKYYKDNEKLSNVINSVQTDEIYDKTNKQGLMHNKYFIFDNKKVWTGSSNISSTDLSGFNCNYAVLITSKEVAKQYLNDFEQMYEGIFHKGKKSCENSFIKINDETQVKALFSPQDNIIYSHIIPLIKSAKKYIYIPIFFITNKPLEEELIKAHNRGVEIKIINDATNAHTKFSVHRDLRKSGIKVKTENYAGKMHSKTLVIDDKYTVLGSLNLTKSANNKNDENVLIIDSEKIAEYMKKTFLYLWNKIPEKYVNYDPKAESFESLGSCYDGLDNDFDEKIDFEDEGCFKKLNNFKSN